jgi:hypothetical protein
MNAPEDKHRTENESFFSPGGFLWLKHPIVWFWAFAKGSSKNKIAFLDVGTYPRFLSNSKQAWATN